jgi:hypothetical protein
MIGRLCQSFGFVVAVILFTIATVVTLYLSYILAIGLVIALGVYTVYQVITVLKKDPS